MRMTSSIFSADSYTEEATSIVSLRIACSHRRRIHASSPRTSLIFWARRRESTPTTSAQPRRQVAADQFLRLLDLAAIVVDEHAAIGGAHDLPLARPAIFAAQRFPPRARDPS